MRLARLITLSFCMALICLTGYAQPSSAPSSSLPVTPLTPDVDANGMGSCDLCRPLEGRPGSDLHRHRRPKDPQLHLNKKAPGVTKSLKRSFTNQLPHRKLDERQERADQ